MIKSFYLRLLFFGIPGLYLAVWLSRFSFSMVNAMPYYYGMIMTAVSIFSGMLIGFTLHSPFINFFRKNYIELFLLEFIFLFIGHIFNWMDVGIHAKYEIIYYFAGLCSIGFAGSLCCQYEYPKERNMLLGGFLLGSVMSFFIGIRYFEESQIDLFLGIPVYCILMLNQLIFAAERNAKKVICIIMFAITAIFISAACYMKDKQNHSELSLLGYTKTISKNNTIDIVDHKNRLYADIKNQTILNMPDLLVYQLQTNKKQLDVLFVGYPGSISPVYFFKSPFVQKVDTFFWDIFTPKGFVHATVGQNIFYRSQWDLFKLFKNRQYDLIVIENMPEESISSRRIFLHYAKKLLKQPHGVIAYPEIIARKYDGTYMKVTSNSSMVMLNGSESTDNPKILEKRYSEFISETIGVPSSMRSKQNIPSKMITEFNSENSAAPHADVKIQTILPTHIFHMLLWIILGLYLIFRLLKCRYKNNQNNFFAFEAGFTFSIIIFSCLMLLSELRLVYPYFSPALFGISVLIMMPLQNKKINIAVQCALFAILIYLTSITFVRTLQPVYVMPVLLPLAFLGIADTLFKCRTNQNDTSMQLQISFAAGVIFTLLLLLFAKNNNLYPTLIYTAIISRLLFYLKI